MRLRHRALSAGSTSVLAARRHPSSGGRNIGIPDAGANLAPGNIAFRSRSVREVSVRTSTHLRSGMNLLEVVVSLAIFLLSMTAVSQLINMSGTNVLESAVRARAALLCQSKLGEIQSGVVSISGGSGTFPDEADSGYEWTVTSDVNGDIPGNLVYDVQVTVKKRVPGRGYVEFTVGQMVLNPSLKGSTQDPAIPSAQSVP